MKTPEQLTKIIIDNLARVDRIFTAVDFAKVCMTSELVSDMNDFYLESHEIANEFLMETTDETKS
jgi:hypothetical protein